METEPLAFRVVRGGMFVAASSYFILFGFLANLVLTRLLAPEAFGTFALAMFFFSLLNLRPKVGMGQAFAQRPQTTGELIGTHLALDVAAGLSSFALALIAAPILLAFGYARPVVWVTLALAAVGISDSVMGTAWVLWTRNCSSAGSAWSPPWLFPSLTRLLSPWRCAGVATRAWWPRMRPMRSCC